MVQFSSSNFVGWLTLKANFAHKKKRSSKSKVSLFFPMKNRYIFWYKTCHEAQIGKFMVEEVGSQKQTILKYPVFEPMSMGNFWASVSEKILSLTC